MQREKTMMQTAKATMQNYQRLQMMTLDGNIKVQRDYEIKKCGDKVKVHDPRIHVIRGTSLKHWI